LACILITACFLMQLPLSAWSKETKKTKPATSAKEPIKGAKVKVKPGPFRVKQVQFKKFVVDNQPRIAAAVIFNRNLDVSSVQQNMNIRMLRKNENHFWVDASTQNNVVRISSNSITWLCGAPMETGFYKMYLRGTLKSADGVYLDCNGDGKGEGGYLPAYESQLYQAVVQTSHPADPEAVERLHDIFD